MARLWSAPSRAYTRYVFSVQYNGRNLLGFSYQGSHAENGIESIEGRIRRALDHLVGSGNYRKLKVSSRTDRGVHAWRNTFHVDIRQRQSKKCSREGCGDSDSSINEMRVGQHIGFSSKTSEQGEAGYQQAREYMLFDEYKKNQALLPWLPKRLVHGLNYHLSRLGSPRHHISNITENDGEADPETFPRIHSNHQKKIQMQNGNEQEKENVRNNLPFIHSLRNNYDIRILSAARAPSQAPNLFFDPARPECPKSNPMHIAWDARFSATRRRYAYRLLYSYDCGEDSTDASRYSSQYHSYPFEHDRVWRIHNKQSSPLDIDSMRLAANHLVGTHDFTSFRGKGCQRSSPVVTLEDVTVLEESYNNVWGDFNGFAGPSTLSDLTSSSAKNAIDEADKAARSKVNPVNSDTLHLITVVLTGRSFVYHQVRNIIACLVEVGQGKMQPIEVKCLLEQRDRSKAPGMAPAHGLFLVDVEHGDFRF